ncbi:MAG: hypothetical protein M1379_16010 [Firmicutes bacterium]|nr:hypothetical protein [Bacillota bacterium]
MDTETVRRWVREFGQRVEQVGAGLMSILARYYPEKVGAGVAKRGEELGHPLCRMVAQCRRLAQALPFFPRSGSFFGLVNILLTWGGLRIWV